MDDGREKVVGLYLWDREHPHLSLRPPAPILVWLIIRSRFTTTVGCHLSRTRSPGHHRRRDLASGKDLSFPSQHRPLALPTATHRKVDPGHAQPRVGYILLYQLWERGRRGESMSLSHQHIVFRLTGDMLFWWMCG